MNLEYISTFVPALWSSTGPPCLNWNKLTACDYYRRSVLRNVKAAISSGNGTRIQTFLAQTQIDNVLSSALYISFRICIEVEKSLAVGPILIYFYMGSGLKFVFLIRAEYQSDINNPYVQFINTRGQWCMMGCCVVCRRSRWMSLHILYTM